MKNGLLNDYEWCDGCHSCEVACKEEHGFPVGQFGIRLLKDGPWEIGEPGPDDVRKWNWNWLPMPTDLCDLCTERVAVGREPTCVHHCLTQALKFGPIDELLPELDKKAKQALFVPCDR